MATVETVRTLLGDQPRFDRQVATGDGVSTLFALTRAPVITDSFACTVDGGDVSPTLNAETGIVTFATAPSGAVVFTFTYAEISDESITALLALESDAYGAAALAAESIAGRYTSSVDKKIGDLSISASQRAKQWADKAKALRTAGRNGLFQPFAGGISVSGKSIYTENLDIVQPAFTRTLHNYEDAASEAEY